MVKLLFKVVLGNVVLRYPNNVVVVRLRKVFVGLPQFLKQKAKYRQQYAKNYIE